MFSYTLTYYFLYIYYIYLLVCLKIKIEKIKEDYPNGFIQGNMGIGSARASAKCN